MVRAVSKWCKRGLGVCCASHSSGWPVPVMQVVALCRAAGPWLVVGARWRLVWSEQRSAVLRSRWTMG